MTISKLYFYIKVLSVVGIMLALYLLWEQFSKAPTNLCTLSGTVNCDAIISGDVSKIMGISTPMYGLVGYILVLVSAMYHWRKILIGVATFGTFFCLWIAYQEFLLKTICPVCISCQVVMIAILALSISVYKHKSIKNSRSKRSR